MCVCVCVLITLLQSYKIKIINYITQSYKTNNTTYIMVV